MRRLFFSTALVAAAASGILLSGADARATVVRRVSLAELVHSSAVIVHGVVRDVNPNLAKSSRGPFRTAVTLEVETIIKGLPAGTSEFTFVLPGGRAGDLEMRIPGMPRFAVGDEVVLLLERTQSGYALAGLAQGVFRVERKDSQATVRQYLDDAAYVDSYGRPAPTTSGEHTLDALLSTLRELAGSGSTSGSGEVK